MTNDAASHRDALIRATRTFAQGLMVDVFLATLGTLYAMLSASDFVWSKTYWQLIALALIKTAMISTTSYAMRLLKPPPA